MTNQKKILLIIVLAIFPSLIFVRGYKSVYTKLEIDRVAEAVVEGSENFEEVRWYEPLVHFGLENRLASKEKQLARLKPLVNLYRLNISVGRQASVNEYWTRYKLDQEWKNSLPLSPNKLKKTAEVFHIYSNVQTSQRVSEYDFFRLSQFLLNSCEKERIGRRSTVKAFNFMISSLPFILDILLVAILSILYLKFKILRLSEPNIVKLSHFVIIIVIFVIYGASIYALRGVQMEEELHFAQIKNKITQEQIDYMCTGGVDSQWSSPIVPMPTIIQESIKQISLFFLHPVVLILSLCFIHNPKARALLNEMEQKKQPTRTSSLC